MQVQPRSCAVPKCFLAAGPVRLSQSARHIRVAATAVLILVWLSTAPASSAQSKPILRLPHKSPSTSQGAAGGFWRIDANFEPVLHLKNELVGTPLTVTPVLYMADGTEYDLPPVLLENAGVASLNIREAIQALPASAAAHISDFGMVGIKYQWSWPAVLATVQDIDQVQSLTFISSLPTDTTALASATAAAAQTINGVWWRPTPGASGFLVLFNAAAVPQTATVQFTDNTGNSVLQQEIWLASHQSTRISLQPALSQISSATGGIMVSYNGVAQSLLAFGGLEDPGVGYSATLHLFEYHAVGSSTPHPVTLDAPGILSGSQPASMQFPAGTLFAPYWVVHNIGMAARTVQVAMTYDLSSAPTTVALGSLTLSAGASQQADLISMIKQSGLQLPNGSVNLSVSYSGLDGEIQSEQGSVDQSGTYVFEVPSVYRATSIGKFICYWSITSDNDTMVSLWNYTTATEHLALTLYFHGGHYVIPVVLGPNGSTDIDILSIVRSGQADAHGNTVPGDIVEGSAMLTAGEDETASMQIASSAATFNVRNATCGDICETCNGITEFDLTPDLLGLAINTSGQSTGQETYNTGTVQNTTTGTWSSSATGIATVNTTGMVSATAQPGASLIEFILDDAPIGVGQLCSEEPVGCPVSNFGAEAPANVVTVTFSPLSVVVAGQTATVTATVNYGSSGSGPAVTLTLTSSGTGTATFSNGSTSMTISGTTSVTIGGGKPSTSANDLTLGATIPSGEGSGTQSVAAPPESFSVVAIPVNFTASAPTNAANGAISFTYTWKSSSGNIQDLSSCTIDEQVAYPTLANPYIWPYPMNQSSTNPTIITGRGNAGGFTDNQGAPDAYYTPYSPGGSFTATQSYNWECPLYNNGNYQSFPSFSNVSITRSVNQNATTQLWQYQATKSGDTNTVVLPNQ